MSEKKFNIDLANADQAAEMMKKFGNLSKNKRAAKRMSKNKDTINELLHSLNTKPKFTKMVEYSLECLKNLAVDITSIEEMIELGLLDTLKKVLQRNPYNEKIQRHVNETLKALCKNDELAKTIQTKLGGNLLIHSMKKHVEPDVVQSTCEIVAQMCVDKDTITDFVNSGMIPAAAHVISSHQDNSDTLAAAAKCLDKAAMYGDNAISVMKSGAVQGVLKGLGKFGDNAELVRYGIGMIATVATSSEEMQDELKKLGAVDTIVAALENHPDDEEILEIGARALMALAGEQDLAGALKIVPQCNLATANALGKVAALVLVPENVDYMMQNEGVEWVNKCMTAGMGDNSAIAQRIMASGATTMERLATDEHKIYSMMQKGAVGKLVETAKNHHTQERVAGAAMNALTKFCTRKENGDYITKSGGIDASLAVANSNEQSGKIARSVLNFWENISKPKDGMANKKVADPAVVARVLAFLRSHGANAVIAKSGLQTLSNISQTEGAMKAIADGDGFRAICDMVKAHPDDEDINKLALDIFSEAAKDPANHEALRKAGAMEALLSIMELHGDKPGFSELGGMTLAQIAGEKQLIETVKKVQEISDKILKNPGLVKGLIDKFNNGLGLLSHLTVIDSNIPPLVKAGAVQALIAAFEACNNLPAGPKKDRALQDAVTGIMRLAKDPEAAKLIVASGALGKMFAVCAANPDNEGLCESTMMLAAELIAAHGSLMGSGKMSSIDDIIKMAQLHPYNENILAACASYIAALCTSDDNIRGILAAGGAKVVVESCFMNMDNPEVLLAGLKLLNQMALDDEAVKALLAAGALDAILEAMRRHPDDATIINACVQALCRLLVNETVAIAIGEKDGIPLLVLAMRTHFKEEGICEVDMIVMDSLASVDNNAERLLVDELQTVELIKWIMDKYGPNKNLVEAGERLLKTLCGIADEDLIFSDESTRLDADACRVLLERILGGELDENQMQLVLDNIAALCANPANAKMMIKNGGLQALAKVMKDWADNEIVFTAAATAFATLCENIDDEDLVMLEDPDLLAAICQMLNPHENIKPLDLSVLAKALGAISKMKLRPEVVENMLKNVPLESLMNLVLDCDDPLLLAQAARLLGKLSNDDEMAERMSEISDLRGLIMAMRRNIQNAEFLKYGVYLLANLAVDDEIKNQVGIEGGMQLLMEIMKTHPANEALIENTLYACAHLSYDADVNVQFIVACKGIGLILGAMQLHSDADDLLESAVSTLCNVCLMNDMNKDYIIKDDVGGGGAAVIVETILNKFNAIELLQTCLRTLGNLAYGTAQSSAIIEAGAVQGIVAGLTVHSEEEEIIDISVRVLTNLASELDDDSQEIMAQEGAVQAIVEVCMNMKDNLEVEVAAIGCLHNLSQAFFNAEMIIKQDGLPCVIDVMNDLGVDAELIEVAFCLIFTLSQLQEEVDSMLDAGLVKSVIQGMKSHHTNETILATGVRILSNLAFNEATSKRVSNMGATDAVMDVMDEMAHSSDVLRHCYQALSSLCRSEEISTKIAERASGAVCRDFKTHCDTYDVCSALLAFMSNLCVSGGASKVVVTKTEAISVILEFAHPHLVKNPNIVKRACRSLENMAYASQPIRDKMKDADCIPGLERWLRAIQDDIKLSAQSAIDSINRVDQNLGDLKVVQMSGPMRAGKSVKELFGEVKEDKVPTLSKETRNFLQAGGMLSKHSKSAAPRPRHVYITDDLTWLVWKDPKKAVTQNTRMKVFKIRDVEIGRCTSQLQRKTLRGKYLAKEECCFSIRSRDRESLDLECSSEAERTKWVACIEELVAFIKMQKQAKKFTLGGV